MNKWKDKTNCPNCGASIQHIYNHQCPYCKTLLDFGIKQTEEIDPRYMYDVEFYGGERDIIQDRMILKFKGKYMPFSTPLEYTNGAMVISAESIIPKDVRYAIAIPMRDYIEFMHNGRLEEFIKHLPFDIDIEKMLDAVMRYREERF